MKHNKKFAFTLAEVLITLGVVGVIAAIALPSLIRNYQVRVLKAQFEVADSIIQQAVKKTCLELGVDTLNDYRIYNYRPSDATPMAERVALVNSVWLKQFTQISPISRMAYFGKGNDMFGEKMNDMRIPYYSNDYFYILPSGVLISPFQNASGGMTMMFDTNGPKKAPNRLGHDIFVYNSFNYNIPQNPGYYGLCNPTVTHSQNQNGCWDWAHRNINPKNNQKGYWEILFKPRSWWDE